MKLIERVIRCEWIFIKIFQLVAEDFWRIENTVSPCELNVTVTTSCLNISSSNSFYLLPSNCLSNKTLENLNILATFSKVSSDSEVDHSNFNRRPLRVAAVISSDYAYDTAVVQNANGSYRFEDSFAVELLKALEFTLNFTSIPVITTFWGHILPNNSWAGMIALLLDDKADLGLSSIADRPFRREVVDFNIPTNEIRLAAFFQKSSISSTPTALLKPFQSEFWVALLLLLVGMVLTTSVVSFVLNNSLFCAKLQGRFELDYSNKEILVHSPISSRGSNFSGSNSKCYTQSARNHNMDTTSDSNWSISDCIMWSVCTISLKGFYKAPTEISFRIAILIGSVAGIVIYAAYSGTLVSFLSVVTEPIQNLGQLLATDFTFVVINVPITLKFLSESPDARGVMLYKRRQTDKPYSSMKEVSDEITKGSFVFVCDHAGAYESFTTDFSTQEACRIREIGIENAQQKQGTLVPKHSPYKRIIDFQILRMIQYGLVKRWSSRYLTKKPVCDSQSEYEGVAIGSSALAFMLLLIFGFVLGSIGLLFELWMHKRITKSSIKIDKDNKSRLHNGIIDVLL